LIKNSKKDKMLLIQDDYKSR